MMPQNNHEGLKAMIGTLANSGAILVGSLIGIAAGRRFP